MTLQVMSAARRHAGAVSCDQTELMSVTARPRDVAVAYSKGTPLKTAIESRTSDRIDEVVVAG